MSTTFPMEVPAFYAFSVNECLEMLARAIRKCCGLGSVVIPEKINYGDHSEFIIDVYGGVIKISYVITFQILKTYSEITEIYIICFDNIDTTMILFKIDEQAELFIPTDSPSLLLFDCLQINKTILLSVFRKTI